MKIKIVSVVLCIGVILMSCSTKKSILGFGSEDFNSFYKEFKNEKEFQLSRIDIPLEYWSYEDIHIEKNEGLSKTMVEKDQISYNDFKFNASVNETIIEKKNEIVVQIRGVDSGIYIDYFFRTDKGKWRLIKVKNSSN